MTDAPPPFTLNMMQVPLPPRSALWRDGLRWCLCVMDPDDPRLTAVCEFYHAALIHGGLTQAQCDVANEIQQDVLRAWSEGALLCQRTPPTFEPGPTGSEPPRRIN